MDEGGRHAGGRARKCGRTRRAGAPCRRSGRRPRPWPPPQSGRLRAPREGRARSPRAPLRPDSARTSSESSRNRLQARSTPTSSAWSTARARSSDSGRRTVTSAVVPNARSDAEVGAGVLGVPPETATGGEADGVGACAGGAGNGVELPLDSSGGAETEGVCTVAVAVEPFVVARRTTLRAWVDVAARPAKAATSAVARASVAVVARRTRAIAASRSTTARRRASGRGVRAGFIHVEADQTWMRRRLVQAESFLSSLSELTRLPLTGRSRFGAPRQSGQRHRRRPLRVFAARRSRRTGRRSPSTARPRRTRR